MSITAPGWQWNARSRCAYNLLKPGAIIVICSVLLFLLLAIAAAEYHPSIMPTAPGTAEVDALKRAVRIMLEILIA
jgi:hypothetical protein